MTGEDTFNQWRLGHAIRPVRYVLELAPNLPAAQFSGQVTINLLVEQHTDVIVCNALDLVISAARVQLHNGEEINVTAIDYQPETERVSFTLDAELPLGAADLIIEFSGELNDKLRGFYRSTFTDEAGNEQIIATTQFEATDARRAFPCWDEPEHKATFEIALIVDETLTALSNAREISRTTHSPGKVRVQFAETMVMSTYLVAIVVGPLDVTEVRMVDGIPLRVAAPRGKTHLTDWALDCGEFGLRYFADYYGIPYPGDKLDLVAVPDFAFGAMENLGCVTFRETLLLVDRQTTTQAELLNVTDVIFHELAHMWFGDLVTMKWWNGIWLNEAFATFMELMATDAYRPDWERWVTFGLARTAAFDTDALQSTRPIEYPVISPADAEGMFDILTYEKGAAVVRMLEQYLGAEAFKAGIARYLQQHAYGNTETTDLWDAIEETANQPVRRIMDSWIFNGGFPTISAEIVNDGRTLRLSQRRCRYIDNNENTEPTTDDVTWLVPAIISLRTPHDPNPILEKVLIDQPVVDIELLDAVLWVQVNAESTGFYRVSYAHDLLESLLRHSDELSGLERYALIDDLWASVLAGDLEAHDFVDALQAFRNETDLSVWQRIIAGLHQCERLCNDEAKEGFRIAATNLLRPIAERLGDEPIDGESDRQNALRGVIFEAMGVIGHDADCRARAKVLLNVDDFHPDPSLVAASVNIVAAHGTAQDFDEFVKRMNSASTPQEQLRFLNALADFPGEDEMLRFLDMCLSDQVRTQNAPLVLRRALTNKAQGAVAWQFIVENWSALTTRLPSNSIARMCEGIRSLPAAEVDEVVAFFESHPVPQGERIIAQHCEKLRVNAALFARENHRFSHRFV